MARPKQMIRLAGLLFACSLWLSACDTVDLYEKNAAIPAHEWKTAFQPQFAFTVRDTTVPYQLYIVLRHNERYNYNNIWLNLQAQAPGGAPQAFRIELPLATSDKGWLGTAMDDLYEHRIPLTLDPEKFNFGRAGDYRFTIGQAMRDDPLANVMNIGLRIEKEKPVAMLDQKKKLRITTIVYWVLLFYIIAALVWWFFSLYTQNGSMYRLRKDKLAIVHSNDPATYALETAAIENQRRRNNAKYIGEGATFFVLILVGAVYIYRSVRRQFRLQQQQQNFVMAITHELKTPISVSRLNLETLQRYKLDEGKKEKLVQVTLQETMRLDSLINNILISSQLDGRSYHISKEELSFSDLVNDVAGQFAARYPERNFDRHIGPDIDINGDPLLLKLLVSNLLENANKYSPKEKPISLRLREKENGVILEVIDEGNGISPEEKRNVFKKFYRIGNEQTRTAKGTGLGLYLCKKIAEDHNGTIAIGDNQPQGSNFMVSLRV